MLANTDPPINVNKDLEYVIGKHWNLFDSSLLTKQFNWFEYFPIVASFVHSLQTADTKPK